MKDRKMIIAISSLRLCKLNCLNTLNIATLFLFSTDMTNKAKIKVAAKGNATANPIISKTNFNLDLFMITSIRGLYQRRTIKKGGRMELNVNINLTENSLKVLRDIFVAIEKIEKEYDVKCSLVNLNIQA